MEAETAAVELLEELVALLRLEHIGQDIFEGRAPRRSLPFVFGGHLMAQALSAAYESVAEPLRAHSLHCYFIEPGDPTAPLEYHVDRLRDGRSFAARSVAVRQAGRVVLTSTISFKINEPGPSYAQPMPSAAAVEATRPLPDWLRRHYPRLPDWWTGPMAIDLRYLDEPPHVLTEPREAEPRQQLWMRASGPLPEDGRLHDCVLAFATDLTLLDPVLLGHGRSWYTGEVRAASLDHALWFHRQVSADRWMLYDQQSPVAANGLGLAHANVYDEDGRLVASAAQQGLVRIRD